MKQELHIHKFKPRKQVVPLHNYVTENGKIIKDLITGKDILKQLVCECGRVETTDLERKLK